MAIFTRRSLAGEPLRIYGDGTQTRDLLYVTDCARFVVDALLSDAVVGQVLNAGTGVDVSVNELAAAIEPDPARIVHVEHIHPQSEIAVLRCDPARSPGTSSAGPRRSASARASAWCAPGWPSGRLLGVELV